MNEINVIFNKKMSLLKLLMNFCFFLSTIKTMIRNTVLLISLLISFSSTALKPDSTYLSHPDSIGLNSETYRVLTPDNLELNVWKLIPTKKTNNNTTIILAYGDSGNMSYWLNHAAMLNQRGFTVIMFDYRGFGESSPFEMNQDQLYYDAFTDDLKSIIKWTKINSKNKKIGLWGLSMGTIISSLALQSETVDFFIGEGFVLDPSVLKQKIFDFKNRDIILPKSAATYKQSIKLITTPMLLFSGSLDQFTTTSDSETIVNQKSNRKLIEYSGNHLQGFQSMTKFFFGDQYIIAMEKFIKKIK